ncbi:MAG: signal recognition particle subunit SRP19/SEC65 family protein [Candidatus Bathyarchaeota archaeon]
MRKKESKIIVWPVYFDISKTRSEGRRLPKRFSINTPRLDEIDEATKLLNLNPQVVPEARYPKFWWQKTGYIIIDKSYSKNKALKTLASKIIELRKT